MRECKGDSVLGVLYLILRRTTGSEISEQVKRSQELLDRGIESTRLSVSRLEIGVNDLGKQHEGTIIHPIIVRS